MSAGAGKSVEMRVAHVTAALGVPEFVYQVALVAKGSATREVGDGLLLCGFGGAVLQVKARSRPEGLRDTDEAAARWVKKHAARAVRQGQGSKRTLNGLQGDRQRLTAFPARSMTLDENDRSKLQVSLDNYDCASWPIIVVIDHPRKVHVDLPYYRDVFYITFSDWHELNQYLRSTHEMIRYVAYVLSHGPEGGVRLGHEFDRFSSMAEYETGETYEEYRGRRLIPQRSFAAAEESEALMTYRNIVDRTWGPNEYLPGVIIEDYQEILDFLDDSPAANQVFVGEWIMQRHRELMTLQHRISGSTFVRNRPLIYICDLTDTWDERKEWSAQLLALTTLRAMEWREQGRPRTNTLGIGVRFRGTVNEFTYVLARSGARMPPDSRRFTEWNFGVASFSAMRTSALRIGRNESCPCGSGRKFKRCHG